MGQAPAEGASDPYRQVAYERGRLPEGLPSAIEIGPLERRVPDERADAQAAVLLFEGVEPLNPADVNEVAGPGQPEGQQRQQALAAGQQLGVLSGLIEKSDRFVERARRRVGEGRRLHGSSRFAARASRAA